MILVVIVVIGHSLASFHLIRLYYRHFLFILLFLFFLPYSLLFQLTDTAFGDTVTIRAITERLLERQTFRLTVVSVDHFFAYGIARRRPDGPLHRVMTAEPRLFAAVLFTLFQERFAVSTCFAYSKNT